MNKLDTSYRPMLTCTCGLTRHVFAGAKRLDSGDVELRYRCSKCNTKRQWGMISIVDEYLDGVIEDVRPSKSA